MAISVSRSDDQGPSASPKPRLLFCSWHSYLDPSSGAALSTRGLFELLAGRGWICKVFSAAALDFEDSPAVAQLLADLGVPFIERPGTAGAGSFSLFHYAQAGVPVTIFDTPPVRIPQEPDRDVGQVF